MNTAAAPAAAQDARDCITPEAFQVQPWLYGLRLARPRQRLAAVLVDALLVAVLSQAGGLVLAMAAALLLWAWRRGRSDAPRAPRRLVGVLGAAAVAWALHALLAPPPPAPARDARAPAALTGIDGAVAGVGVARLFLCDDRSCRAAELSRLDAALQAQNISEAERREALLDLADGVTEDPAERAALRRPYEAPALEAGGTAPAAAAALQPPVAAAPAPQDAGPALLDRDGSFSLMRTLQVVAAEVGFSVGWGAVYFTLLTALWDGQTPGKRLLRIRVVALSGRPLGYRDAFERYGGYAAGFATGLLGFLQVFWDDNRQAIHDRIAFTAVIRDEDGQALARARAAAAGSAAR